MFSLPPHQHTVAFDGNDVPPSLESDERIVVLTQEAQQALFCPELCSVYSALSLLPCDITGRERAEPQAGIAAILVGEITTRRAQLYLSRRAESQVGGTAERQAWEKVCCAFSDKFYLVSLVVAAMPSTLI